MKKLVAITIVLFLLACVLPMARAQQDSVRKSSSAGSEVAAVDSAEDSTSPETEQKLAQKREQLLKTRQALQARLEKLELEKRMLQHELDAMSHADHQP